MSSMSTILQTVPSMPVDLTMSTVAAMISRVYLDVEVQSVAPLAGGMINAVFEITCTKLPTKLVLKIYADTHHWKLWDWMMARDPSTPWLPALAEDIRRLAGSGE